MKTSMTLVVLACALIITPTSHASLLPQIEYEEDFLTTTYMDAEYTTAEWDTVLGEVRLPAFPQTVVGSVNPTGLVLDAVPYGPYLLVASGSLGIYDVSDPTNPHSVAVVSTAPATVQAIAVGGRYAYLACGADGLKVVDLADPLAGSIVGTWDRADDAKSIAVAGNLVLLGEPGALWVIDVADPTTPVDIGRYTRECNGVVFAGNLAYVASGINGLRVMSIENPLIPAQIGTVSTGGTAHGVDVAGDLACIAAGGAGLVTVDVSDPTNPVVLGSYPTVDAFRVTIEGDFAYVADRNEGGLIFDIRQPADPTPIQPAIGGGLGYAFVPWGYFAYLCRESAGLDVVVTADEVNPPLIPGTGPVLSTCVDLAMSGSHAVSALGSQGVMVTDFSNPNDPLTYGWASGFDGQNVAVAGDYAYAAGGDGLVVIDITDPTMPTPVVTGIGASDVAADEHILYLAGGGISAYDIKDPANPVLLDSFTHQNLHAYALAVQGNRVVALSNDAGQTQLWMFDVSDPTSIALDVFTIGSFSWMDDIILAENAVYLAGQSGLIVFEITAVGALGVRGSDSTNELARVTMAGEYLYASGPGGIQFYDLADPFFPYFLYTIDQPAFGLAFSGDYLYAGTYTTDMIAAIEILQRRFDIFANQVQSLPVYAGTYQPERLYWSVTGPEPPGTMDWGYSLDGAGGWEQITHNFQEIPYTSNWSDLRWLMNLNYNGGGINPTITDIRLKWWFGKPIIDRIEDVPNDQGRQVRLHWYRGADDFVVANPQVIEYAIYRVIDDPDKSAWGEYIASVPAFATDHYATIAPTLADSTSAGIHWSTFYLMPVFDPPRPPTVSNAASGYSIDNLAPFPPMGAMVGAGLQLSWDPPIDEDFRYVTVYGSESGVLDGTEVVVGYAIGTEFDASVDIHPYYILTATDFAGNEGEAVALTNHISDVPANVPARTALLGNSPNPFNPATTVAFELANSGRVVLEIYDLAGRRIAVLEDKVFEAGRHEVAWAGRDGAGRSVPTGIYLCRMTAAGYEATSRMTLLK